jgi:hypothetical protein
MVTHADHREVRVMDRVRQMLCGLHGHDSMLQFEQDRMYLRCVSCGHETPGWELNETAPTTTVKAAPKQPIVQQPIVQPQLISARRVA